MIRAGVIALCLAWLPCHADLYSVNATDDALSRIDATTAAITPVGALDPAAPGPGSTEGMFATPVAMAIRPYDGAIVVWNDSGLPNSETDRILAIVDRCTGKAVPIGTTVRPLQSKLNAIAYTRAGRLHGLGTYDFGTGPVDALFDLDDETSRQGWVRKVQGFVNASPGRQFHGLATAKDDELLYSMQSATLVLAVPPSPRGPGRTSYLRVRRLVSLNYFGTVTPLGSLSPLAMTLSDAMASVTSGSLVMGARSTGGFRLYDVNTMTGALANPRLLSGNAPQGIGSSTPAACPLPPANGWASITALTDHACALARDGTAHCWGRNDEGELGDGTTTSRSTPTPVAGIAAGAAAPRFRSLSAGDIHTCGIGTDGVTYCWGYRYGPRPVPVATTQPFTAIAAGSWFTCALDGAGAAQCWGYNGDGELGNGQQPVDQWSPTAVTMPAGVNAFTTITAGLSHACALSAAGDAYCWGLGASGQLGDGTSGAGQGHPIPQPVWGMHKFSAISASREHTCAVTTLGEALCWGHNRNSEIGIPSSAYGCYGCPAYVVSIPVAVDTGLKLESIETGVDHTCGLTPAGLLYCWGAASAGELGVGGSYHCPSMAYGCSKPANTYQGNAYIAVAAGKGASCALTAAGHAYCWGTHPYMLGAGATTSSHKPLLIANP